MKRVIALLLILCAGCAQRTDNLVSDQDLALDFEFDEFCDKVGQIDNRGASTYAVGDPAGSEDRIKDVTYYIFDSKGICVSRQFEEDFTGSSKISLIGKDAFTVYAIVNCRELIEFPAADGMTVSRLEEMTVPHQETYDYLPFTGKVTIDLVSDPSIKTVKIKLTRVNSAIRVVNDSADRIDITNTSVSNLPSEGYLFKEGVPAGVEYSATGKPSNADGDIFSFYIPQSQMGKLSFDIEAVTLDENKEVSISSPIKFSEELATGDRATAMVGYLESGTLKVGSPDNWGNVGRYELPGGVQLQVVGGEFFDYKSVKGLRASSGGGEFSFIVKATEGVASLSVVGSVDWVTVRDNVIVVSQNTGSSERECQIAIAVGGKNIGVFYIVQGKGITFSCASLSIVNNRLEKIGGTGSSSALYTVTFDISDDELDEMEIVSEGNGANGITVDINREAKSIAVHFMALVDASVISPEGVSVPVKFVDANGRVNATLNVTQRPVKITFNPVKYPNISYQGGEVIASVTIEGNSKWNVKSILDKSGNTVTSWLTKIEPTSSANSGGNLKLEVAANSTSSSRIAYVLVQSSYTVSKPYEIIQAPSYGLKNISANVGWDASTSTLKAYSKGSTYTFTFETETAVPEHIALAVDCDPNGTGSQGITASEITNTATNTYSFTVTVPDSDDTDEEVTSSVNITADGATIGSFTVRKAYKPSFISVNEEVWGGVKNRPALKKATYRASEWDLKDFTSDNDKLKVTTEYHGDITVSYAETMMHNDTPQTATITMNLNGGNKVTYTTTQAPVAFTISDADLAKLENVVKEGGDIGGITVMTQAGSVGTPWRVASASDTWLTTDPAIDGTETNASGSTLTVKFAANDTGDRTGSFVLESRNTTSPAYAVSQRGTFGVTVSGVTYNGKTALFADGMLKAFSAKYDYTFNITTDNAVEGNRLTVVSKTSGTAVTVKTPPSGTALTTSHSFVITVPASTLTTEPESTFDIMADGNRIGGFTVKQAKKAGFAASTSTVNVTSVMGGIKSRPTLKNGSFVASEWDVSGVTSSNGSLPVSAVNVAAGTFKVDFAETLTSTSAAQSATITLDGADGTSRGSYSTTQKKVTFTFNPTSYTFPGQASLTQNIAVTTDAGAEWSVASNTNSAAISSTKSGSNLVLKTVANAPTTSDATANITLTLNDCTSQVFVARQLRAMSATFTAPSGCVYASNTLSAYSAAKTYDFTLALNRAVDASKISIVRTSGSLAVPTLTTTGSKTSHTVRVSVPASTTTTEPTSTFTIIVDGDLVQTFTVKQAKKPSISVSTATVIGGSGAVSGSFTASTWDVKSSAYVTSSNSNMGITLPSGNNGTFTVGMAASMDQTFTNRSATITLVGVTGNLATCSIAQNKVVYAFSPTSLKFEFDETSAGKTVTVTSSNAGTISSGMTATSSQTWCTVSVSGNKVTAKVTQNTGNTSRTATVYVTYRNSRSQTFDVVQDSGGPATITIGGLQWTLYNLANPAQASGGATFATKLPSQCTGNRSESHGRFYQWNRNVSWNTIGSSASGANPSGTWQTTNPSGTSWGSSTNPCPSGFVVPTKAQWNALISACNATYMSGSWSSNNYGYLTLTDKTNTSNKLEFPAVGYRNTDSAGTLNYYGTCGYYWSSVQSSSSNAHGVSFDSSSVDMNTHNRQNGFSVRCVRQ